jgi:hypothetical protein
MKNIIHFNSFINENETISNSEKVLDIEEFIKNLESIKEDKPFYFYADKTDPKKWNLCLVYGKMSFLGWIFSSKVGQSEKWLQESTILDKLEVGDFKEQNIEEFINMVKESSNYKQCKIISTKRANNAGYIIFQLM